VIRLNGPAGADAAGHRRALRPLFRRLPDRRRADRAGVGHHHGENVLLNEHRTGLITTLRRWARIIEILNIRETGGEQVGDIRVKHSS
jgi:hypothetical protein